MDEVIIDSCTDLTHEMNGASGSVRHADVDIEHVYTVPRQQQQQNRASSDPQRPTVGYPAFADPLAPNAQRMRMAPAGPPRQRRVHPEIVDLSNVDSPNGTLEPAVTHEVAVNVPNPLRDNGLNHRASLALPQTQMQLHQQMLLLRERELHLQERQRIIANQEWQQRQNAARHQLNTRLPWQAPQQPQYQHQRQQQQQQHYPESYRQPIQPQQQHQDVSRNAVARSDQIPVDVYNVTQHSPMVNPRHPSYPALLQSYYTLHGDMACACTFSVLLKMSKQEGTSAGSKISKALSHSYREHVLRGLTQQQVKHVEFPKVLLALACRGCYQSREHAGKPFDKGAVHFPTSFPSFLSQFYELKEHQMTCRNLAQNMKLIISGKSRHPEFSYQLSERIFIRQICESYKLFPSDGPNLSYVVNEIIENVIYDDNVGTMEDALQTTSMTFRGVTGTGLCDIVDSDIVADDPFCLFALESLELVRIYKRYSIPEHQHFFTQEPISEAETELFVLQCRCCRGRRKDGSFNPDAVVVLRYCDDVEIMKQVVLNIMTLVSVHLQTCLTGSQLQRMESLKVRANSDVFSSFAVSLRRHLVTILAWAHELRLAKPAEPPSADRELWRSLSMDKYEEMLRSGNTNAIIDVSGKPKAKGSPGSAVLECFAFPRIGLLHGEMGLPTRHDMKMSFRKRRRPDDSNDPNGIKSPRSMVSDFTILPVVALSKTRECPEATATTVVLGQM